MLCEPWYKPGRQKNLDDLRKLLTRGKSFLRQEGLRKISQSMGGKHPMALSRYNKWISLLSSCEKHHTVDYNNIATELSNV